jgi:hypothetical protein
VLFRSEQAFGLGEEQIGIVDFRFLLRALALGGFNVGLVTLDQRFQLLGALTIELDPVAMRGDLVLQSLHLGSALR